MRGLLLNVVIWIASLIHFLVMKFVRWVASVFKRLGDTLVRAPAPKKVGERSSVKGEKTATVQSEETASPSSETDAEAAGAQKQLRLPDIDQGLPPIEILDEAPKAGFTQADDDERARLIEDALASYGIEAEVKQINPGPSVTQFGVEPGWARKYKKIVERDQDGKPKMDKDGNVRTRMEEISKTRVKVERITSLANDLALVLAVPDIRIEAPVPGKPLVGIEVPNVSSEIVSLRSVVESSKFQKAVAKSKLTLALGQGAGGEPMYGDLAKMPHLLIAGATGSGKTVCLNSTINCLLMQASPADVRFVLVDPKRVEMVTFSDMPHLITPVITDVDKAVDALRRVSIEMDNRYRKFSSVRARNIESYNQNPEVTEKMPYIVVVIDELADLMMTSGDVVEPLICRLAQLARATGIHLVVATQRPSVDVITGLIKANFPTRISFAVVSSVDSRTILDTVGAEKLLGKGDMLYIPPEASKPKRIRGCYVSDEEIERLVGFWKEWAAKHWPREYDTVARDFASLSVEQMDTDPFLEKARELCHESSNISISFLQRKLHIGYQRAARLMEQLEEEGTIEPGGGYSEEE
ncbi:MAG: DNA translocase FtsK [Dehalococcoidia bacterium]